MIIFENETNISFSFDPIEIAEKVVLKTLEIHNIIMDIDVNICIVSDEVIKITNKENRNIDSVTDVLSFPYLDYDEPGVIVINNNSPDYYDVFDPDSGNLVLGDIMLCASRIISQSEEYGHSILREYAFLIAHSMLHLLGYDHMDDIERRLMEEKQDYILNLLGITRG